MERIKTRIAGQARQPMRALFVLSVTTFGMMTSVGQAVSLITSVEFGIDMVVDARGNTYFTGGFPSDPNSEADSATTKYDRQGRLVWESEYRGPADSCDFSSSSRIEVDARGNVYVTGTSLLRPGVGKLNGDTWGYMTVKYGPSGNQVWTASYEEPEGELGGPRAIAVDGDGNVYITGDATRSGWADPYSDLVTIKYNSKGSQQWVARYGTQPYCDCSPADLDVDKHGNTYVTGNYRIHTGPLQDTDFRSIVTIKYDTNGKERWVAQFAGDANSINSSVGLTLDKKGSVYVVGSSRSATRSEFVTIKYTMNGKEQWVARLSEPREKWFLLSYVKTDVEGNAYVTTEMDPAWLGPSYSSARYLESELSEFVTVKYNPRGKEEWRAKYRAPHGQRISLRGMMIAGGGDVLVVGLNQRNPFDAGMLVITYDAKGNEKEVKRFETVPELVRFLGQLSLR